jgi:hypothetical protein
MWYNGVVHPESFPEGVPLGADNNRVPLRGPWGIHSEVVPLMGPPDFVPSGCPLREYILWVSPEWVTQMSSWGVPVCGPLEGWSPEEILLSRTPWGIIEERPLGSPTEGSLWGGSSWGVPLRMSTWMCPAEWFPLRWSSWGGPLSGYPWTGTPEGTDLRESTWRSYRPKGP